MLPILSNSHSYRSVSKCPGVATVFVLECHHEEDDKYSDLCWQVGGEDRQIITRKQKLDNYQVNKIRKTNKVDRVSVSQTSRRKNARSWEGNGREHSWQRDQDQRPRGQKKLGCTRKSWKSVQVKELEESR